MTFKQLGFGKVISEPGLSCKDIADRQVYSQGDGEYWIAPDGSNNSFIVYCDMTTDGGLYHMILFPNSPIFNMCGLDV